MCPPVIAIAALAVTAAGTAAAYKGQQDNANAQNNYNNDQYAAVTKAATANYLQQAGQIQNRAVQDTAQTKQQAQADMISGEKAKASAETGMAEHGVTGNSVQALLGDFSSIEARNQGTLSTNLAWRQQQYGEDVKQARAEAQQRISGAAPAPTAFPSALAAGLQIGGSALGTFDKIYQQQDPNAYNKNTNNTNLPPGQA